MIPNEAEDFNSYHYRILLYNSHDVGLLDIRVCLPLVIDHLVDFKY